MRKIFNNVTFEEYEMQKILELRQEIATENLEIPEKFTVVFF